MLDFFGESVSIELNFEKLTLVFRGQKETVKSSIMVTKNATKVRNDNFKLLPYVF